ncbi:MAG: methyltransferase [Ktedonobacteraceae bacterium]|nr:methyltransferase [Ktedonobacteraceae bacterium]
MTLPSYLLRETVPLETSDQVLILNSSADPFVPHAAHQVNSGTITLAEDNVAVLGECLRALQGASADIHHAAFHDYLFLHPQETMTVAAMNLLYQPSNAWIHYGLQVAFHTLQPGGHLYVTGAKDRGILSLEKRMQTTFGNVRTLKISKGHRVISSQKVQTDSPQPLQEGPLRVFAGNQLDEGTRLLLGAIDVRATDTALDLGCGAGFIGLHLARLAPEGEVTMVDVSLAAVAETRSAVEQSGLANIHVLPSDGAQAVLSQRFDLVATNPPFHQGAAQTMEIAERFIREAAQVLRSAGRLYLVANRFLKYEPQLRACFQTVKEVEGNTRYKVLCACEPLKSAPSGQK